MQACPKSLQVRETGRQGNRPAHLRVRPPVWGALRLWPCSSKYCYQGGGSPGFRSEGGGRRTSRPPRLPPAVKSTHCSKRCTSAPAAQSRSGAKRRNINRAEAAVRRSRPEPSASFRPSAPQLLTSLPYFALCCWGGRRWARAPSPARARSRLRPSKAAVDSPVAATTTIELAHLRKLGQQPAATGARRSVGSSPESEAGRGIPGAAGRRKKRGRGQDGAGGPAGGGGDGGGGRDYVGSGGGGCAHLLVGWQARAGPAEEVPCAVLVQMCRG